MFSISVGDNVGLSGGKGMRSAVGQLVDDLAIQNVDHVAASAPMIGDVTL